MITVRRPLKVAAFFVASAGLALVVVPRAGATAKHIEHGAACQWFFDGIDQPPPLGGQHRGEGIMHQDTGSLVTAVCALERSNTTNTTGLLDLEVRIVSLEGNTVSVTCFADAQRTDGSTALSVAKSGFGTNFKIDFGSALNKSSSGGSYVVSCDLPAFTTIQSVYSSEP
jgi:hypothetical protein